MQPCIENNTTKNLQNYIAFVIIDLINLILALCGIWKLRRARGGIWNVLYRQVSYFALLAAIKCEPQLINSEQGVVWITVAVLMYCVPLVRVAYLPAIALGLLMIVSISHADFPDSRFKRCVF